MKAVIIKIFLGHPANVQLQWDLEQASESGSFLFDVDRSGSPDGPWTTLTSSPLVDTYTYTDTLADEEANTLSLVRDIYYRIRAEPPSGPSNQVYSAIVNLDGLSEYEILPEEPGNPERPVPIDQYEPDPQTFVHRRPHTTDARYRLVKRALARNMYLMLKKLNGIKFKLLKRRHFGTRCTVCYDPMSRMVFDSHCATCYGTSWVGGYYTPIEIYGQIVRGSGGHIQTQLSPQAKDDLNFPQIRTLDFPRIDPGDVLVAMDRNRRFLVKQRYNSSIKTISVHQTLAVSELPRTAVEYDVDAQL
jgi:hypothetical protein